MNLSQVVSEAQRKSWLDNRSTQSRRVPKSLPVQFRFVPFFHELTISLCTATTEGMFVSAIFIPFPARVPDCALKKGPMDILLRTMRKEGVLALYKGSHSPFISPYLLTPPFSHSLTLGAGPMISLQ